MEKKCIGIKKKDETEIIFDLWFTWAHQIKYLNLETNKSLNILKMLIYTP